MLIFLSNAFNDPSNPWYYVIGVLFLILIFGALALYVILSGKKKSDNPDVAKDEKREEEKTEYPPTEPTVETNESKDNNEN